MNEFGYLAEYSRAAEAELDLTELSLWLVQTPCGPLCKSRVSPDRELATILR